MKKSTSILTIIAGVICIAFIAYCVLWLLPRFQEFANSEEQQGAGLIMLFAAPLMIVVMFVGGVTAIADFILGGVGLKKIGSRKFAVASACLAILDLLSAAGMVLTSLAFCELIPFVAPYLFALFLIAVAIVRFITARKAPRA